jgi:hypothetical protein
MSDMVCPGSKWMGEWTMDDTLILAPDNSLNLQQGSRHG